MATVEISRLRKQYGDVVALSDISVTIESGSFYTLLGPSGCGKTTLLRTIAGFHSQNSGSIRIDGAAIENLPAHRRDVGMVFQDYAVFPHMNVADNIAFGLKQRRIGAADIRKRVDEVLEVVQLGALKHRMPHELSGGQQQRVGLARAIVVRPKVLLMDEPLSNLDARLRVDLRAELRRIQRELNITTIYVTHDQEEALAMSDTVCVMHGGVIQQATGPLDIYARPANRFVATFVGANNFLATDRSDGGLRLRSGGADLSGSLTAPAGSGGVVAAIRPELLQVHPCITAAGAQEIALDCSLIGVSFIGREMEVFARTSAGEEVKAIARPDSAVLGQSVGAPVTLTFRRADLLAFADTETGALLS